MTFQTILALFCWSYFKFYVVAKLLLCNFVSVRVYSAYVKEIEGKPSANEWGSKLPFAALLGEYSNGGGEMIV